MTIYNELKLTDLALGLRDLFDKRLESLRLSTAGRYFEPQLRERLAEITGLPPALFGSVPLAQQLETADVRHDGFASTIYFVTEAHLRLPDVAPEVRAAAERVRMAFIPRLSDLNESYATEAHQAQERGQQLAARKADLERFPIANGRTLYQVAEGYVAAGKELDDLLSERADAPRRDRGRAASIRSRTLGLLYRLREDLAEERQRNAELPADIAQRTLGYFDQLAAMRSGPAARPAEPTRPGETPRPAEPTQSPAPTA